MFLINRNYYIKINNLLSFIMSSMIYLLFFRDIFNLTGSIIGSGISKLLIQISSLF